MMGTISLLRATLSLQQRARWSSRKRCPGLGRVVEVYHPQGYLTRYAHLANFADGIRTGVEVQPGTPLGTIGGSTTVGGRLVDWPDARAFGPHLHFSVFRWAAASGRWEITDPFGWDPWTGPDTAARLAAQKADPLVKCNGEVSYDLWVGEWPGPYGKAAVAERFRPTKDRYVGGWLDAEVQAALAQQAPSPTPRPSATPSYAELAVRATALQATVQVLETRVAALSTALAAAVSSPSGTPRSRTSNTITGKWELANEGGDCFSFLNPETLEFLTDGTYVSTVEMGITQQIGGKYTRLADGRVRFESQQMGMILCDAALRDGELLVTGAGGQTARYAPYEELSPASYPENIAGQWTQSAVSGSSNTCLEPFDRDPDAFLFMLDGEFRAEAVGTTLVGAYAVSGTKLRLEKPDAATSARLPTPTPAPTASSAEALGNLLGFLLSPGGFSDEPGPAEPFQGTADCAIALMTHSRIVLADSQGNSTTYRRQQSAAAVEAAASATAAVTFTPQPTRTPTPTPTPTAQFGLQIIPFDYQVGDAFGGWREATLRVAYVNNSNRAVGPRCLLFRGERFRGQAGDTCEPGQTIIISDAYVETSEGKTYPAEPSTPGFRLGGFGSDHPLPIPPGFPFYDPPQAFGSPESFKFQFAQAAHPTRLVLHGTSDIAIDLVSVPTAIPTPDLKRVATKPLSALAGRVLLDQMDKLKATLNGTCYHQQVEGFGMEYVLPLTVVNRDQLDEATAEPDFFYAVYYRDNSFAYHGLTEYLYAGPGQTVTDSIMLPDSTGYNVSPDYLLLWEKGEYPVAYTLNCTEK